MPRLILVELIRPLSWLGCTDTWRVVVWQRVNPWRWKMHILATGEGTTSEWEATT